MERCPVCRARLSASVCRRCGADYTQAFALAEQAQSQVHEALSLWARGYLETAAQLLQHSLSNQHEPLVALLLDCLLEQLLQQAVQYLQQNKTAEAKQLCGFILTIKFMPLAAQLRDFLQGEIDGFYSDTGPL